MEQQIAAEQRQKEEGGCDGEDDRPRPGLDQVPEAKLGGDHGDVRDEVHQAAQRGEAQRGEKRRGGISQYVQII